MTEIRKALMLNPEQHRLLIDLAIMEKRTMNGEIEYLLEKRREELLAQ